MKIHSLFLPLGLATASSLWAQTPNEATLTFVDQGDKNEIEIDLDVSIIGSSDDESTVSGTMDVRVNISPATGKSDELTVLSADAAASDVRLRRNNFFTGSYDLNARDLTFDLSTIEEPGVVDPETGDFEASQYLVTTTGGTVSGNADNPLLPQEIEIEEVPLDDPPFSGSAGGTGNLTVTPGRVEGRRLYYDLSVTLPVGLEQSVEIPALEDLPIQIDVDFALQGELEATGETFLEFPTYEEWASEVDLESGSQNDSDIHPSAPNYFYYALGFDADNAPADLFSFGPDGAVLQTASEIALDEFEIQWSDDLINWTRVPANAMISGGSRLGFPDSLVETPTVALSSGKKYLRLARPSAP